MLTYAYFILYAYFYKTPYNETIKWYYNDILVFYHSFLPFIEYTFTTFFLKYKTGENATKIINYRKNKNKRTLLDLNRKTLYQNTRVYYQEKKQGYVPSLMLTYAYLCLLMLTYAYLYLLSSLWYELSTYIPYIPPTYTSCVREDSVFLLCT